MELRIATHTMPQVETQPLKRLASLTGGNGNGHMVASEPRLSNAATENGLTHILVATRLHPSDREAILLALRMASAPRARVTLLHVLAPFDPPSVHWLDAINNLHRALSGQSRDEVLAAQQGREAIFDFLDREIPPDVRGTLKIHAECRVGDVPAEIARVADEQSADLIFLCDRPSRWRPSILSGLSQRIVQLSSKPIVFARPSANGRTSGAAQ